MIGDLNDLIESYDTGMYSLEDVLNRILSLASTYPMDVIITDLPEHWRTEFLSWARRKFDNDIPLHQFVTISQGKSGSEDLIPIARIREWFREHDSFQ
jgi:hypothetical protein